MSALLFLLMSFLFFLLLRQLLNKSERFFLISSLLSIFFLFSVLPAISAGLLLLLCACLYGQYIYAKEFFPKIYLICSLMLILVFKWFSRHVSPGLEIYDLPFLHSFPFILPWGVSYILFQGFLFLSAGTVSEAKMSLGQFIFHLLFPAKLFSFSFSSPYQGHESGNSLKSCFLFFEGLFKVAVISPFFYDLAWTSNKFHWSSLPINAMTGLLTVYFNVSGYWNIAEAFCLNTGLKPDLNAFMAKMKLKKEFAAPFFYLVLLFLYRQDLSLFLSFLIFWGVRTIQQNRYPLLSYSSFILSYSLLNFWRNPPRYESLNAIEALNLYLSRSIGRSPKELVIIIPLSLLFLAQTAKLKDEKLKGLAIALMAAMILFYGRKDLPLPLLITM